MRTAVGEPMNVLDIELMLATLVPPFSRDGWIFEIKYDGYRLLIAKRGSSIELVTRNRVLANEWFPEIVSSIAAMKGDFILDTEICAIGEDGWPDFELMKKLARPRRKAAANFQVYAFDVISIGKRDVRPTPLLARKAQLQKLLSDAPPRLHYVQHVERLGKQFYDEVVNMGLEGVVGKRADAAYVGGRSRDWLKSKPAGLHDGWKRTRRPGDRA